MSMHEIEALVEYSIKTLAEQAGADIDIRSAIWRLYEFQEQFDCSFTHFRVMDELLKHRFAYKMATSRHPRYSEPEIQQYFNELDDNHAFINVDPLAEWSSTNNPMAGYIRDGRLYCDVGSPLWHELVAKGELSGTDAEPPQPLSLEKVVLAVLQRAEAMVDGTWLIQEWFSIYPYWFPFDDEEALRELQVNPDVAAMRTIFRRLNLHPTTPGSDEPMEFENSGFPKSEMAQWWFDLEV